MMRWAVQSNLGKTSDIDRIGREARRLGHEVAEVQAIPFSEQLPDVPNDMPTVFYGATSFVRNVYNRGKWGPWSLFNPAFFRYSIYLEQYKDLMLNYGARLTTIGDFKKLNMTGPVFVRPERDHKEFCGEVIEAGDFEAWADRISCGGYTFDETCPIVVAEPKNIEKEYRLFIVNGFTSGSLYRQEGRLHVEPGVPFQVKDFAREALSIWRPAPIFVMDIARTERHYKILELGTFNSAGFYGADIESIVGYVSTLADSTLNR